MIRINISLRVNFCISPVFLRGYTYAASSHIYIVQIICRIYLQFFYYRLNNSIIIITLDFQIKNI
jgi:hypothetical protein